MIKSTRVDKTIPKQDLQLMARNLQERSLLEGRENLLQLLYRQSVLLVMTPSSWLFVMQKTHQWKRIVVMKMISSVQALL